MRRKLNPRYEKVSAVDRERNSEVLETVFAGRPENHGWPKDVIANAHRKSYAFRIQELLDQTDHLMAKVVGNETKWTQQLRSVRDGIGHVLTRQDDMTVQQMIAMLDPARLLAELVLLRQLRFTHARCRNSLGHHWELDNVREHVKKGYPRWFAARAQASLRVSRALMCRYIAAADGHKSISATDTIAVSPRPRPSA
jgi:hypothetical protein